MAKSSFNQKHSDWDCYEEILQEMEKDNAAESEELRKKKRSSSVYRKGRKWRKNV